MSLESHLNDATFGESMAWNGFDYFEVWPHEFDFGTPKMTTFWRKIGHFRSFLPKTWISWIVMLYRFSQAGKSKAGNISMSLEGHLNDATFGESMAGNGFDYFEIWPLEFDFGTLKMTTFWRKIGHFRSFLPKTWISWIVMLYRFSQAGKSSWEH